MTFGRLRLLIIVTVIAALPTIVFGQAQANTGAIEGIVNDPSSRPVPNAEVAVTNVGTNFTRTLKTDSDGRFRALLLPLGPYKVTAKAPNFGTQVRQGLDLAVGQTVSLTITLNISQVEQVVSVSGEAPIIE